MMAAANLAGEGRRAGANAAAHLFQNTPELGTVPDAVAAGYDAVAVEPLTEHDTIDVRAPLRRGDRVEIKSAIARLKTGRRGRFYFRNPQHERLVEAGGRYLLAVCEPKPDRRVIAAAVVDATALEDSRANWIHVDATRGYHTYKQVRWGVFFDSVDVPGEGQEATP